MASSQKQKLTIMIIDNEMCGLDRTRKMLETEHIKVIPVFVQDVLYFLNKEKPDLLLLNADINIKIGLKVINFIRHRYVELPIMLVVSAYGCLSKDTMVRLGIRDFLNNAFDKDKVLNKIQRALEERGRWDENEWRVREE